MTQLTQQQFQLILPRCHTETFYPYLQPALTEFGITSDLQTAAFLANVAHESAELRLLVENLNYSVEGLMKTWPSRFQSVAFANQYAHFPERIANYVYAGRMGNGDEESGDGWKFRGVGAIQITGRALHTAFSAYCGVPLDLLGPWLQSPEGALRSAGWFWQKHGLGPVADRDDFDTVCDLINLGHKSPKVGASLGYAERLAYYTTIKRVLGV